MLAVLAACLAIVLGPHVVGDNATETDFYGGYARGAALIQHGHIDLTRYAVVGPGYEVALATAGGILGNLFLGAQLLSTLAITVTLLAWFHLLRPRIGAVGAAAATLLTAANPTFLRYGYSATTDALALALQSVALLLMFTRATRWRMLLAGLVAAAAILTRYTAVYLLPAAVLASWVGAPSRAGRWRTLAPFVAGVTVPLALWFGALASSAGGARFLMFHMISYEAFARARGLSWDEYQHLLQPQIHSFADVIRYDPGQLARQVMVNLGLHAWLDATQLLGILTAVTAAAGVVFALRDRAMRGVWPLAIAGLVAYLSLVPVTYSERYSLMMLPVYTMLAGVAFGSALLPLRAQATGARPLKPLLVALPLAASLWDSVQLQRYEMASLPVEVLGPAKVLREQARPGDGIIARKPHVAYLGGVEMVPFPFNENFPELVRYAREHRARWLFISTAEVMARPANLPLLDTTGVVPGLTPRYFSTEPPAVLYEIGPELGTPPTWASDVRVAALRLARARVRLDPDSENDPWVAALVEIDRGQWQEARETLRRASRLDVRGRQALAEVVARDSTRAVHTLLSMIR